MFHPPKYVRPTEHLQDQLTLITKVSRPTGSAGAQSYRNGQTQYYYNMKEVKQRLLITLLVYHLNSFRCCNIQPNCSLAEHTLHQSKAAHSDTCPSHMTHDHCTVAQCTEHRGYTQWSKLVSHICTPGSQH